VKNACCKHMFQVFQMFQRYVTSISCGCCKSRSGCCICCTGCSRMLQASVPNVSSVFSRRMLQVCLFWMLHMFHIYVASVLSRYCLCFTMVFKCFSCVLASVSDAYFKYFICLQTYVANVASACFKSRLGVASPSSILLPHLIGSS
jgi:hypothetical protein